MHICTMELVVTNEIYCIGVMFSCGLGEGRLRVPMRVEYIPTSTFSQDLVECPTNETLGHVVEM